LAAIQVPGDFRPCHNRRTMNFRRRHVPVAAATMLCLVGGATSAPVLGAVRPPKLEYQITKLPNGLTVILSEDHSTPIVHLQIWYHVGSKDEKPGRTGFAHLFEHMMFKGSKNVEPEQHTSMISSIGGKVNAYTTEDVTVFWETVPSHYLPLAVWLEADRMATLRIDEATFRNEREVVKEERRMRVENQPYGRLQEIVYSHAFEVHPYRHPTIGSMADLEAASIDDVREFYETYYVLENATLCLVGAFDSTEAMTLIKRYFGPIPKAPAPIVRNIPREPPKTKERRITLEDEWPLPAVVVAHHITYDGHPDSYPLHIASKLLSDGQSSRIHRKLVYEDRIALAAFGGGNIIEHPNLFYSVAIVQPGRTPEDAANALIAELDRLKNEAVPEREVQRAKNQFARDYIISRESNQEKAAHLAHAAVIHDDITTADGEFDIFMSITPADVQRVARTYFTPENRLVMTILPKGRGGSSTGTGPVR
jgi:zinc protease